MYFSLLPNWISDMSVTFSSNSSYHLKHCSLFPTMYDDHNSKYVCSKNSLIVKKVIQLPLWSLINGYIFCIPYPCMVWFSNTIMKYLYGRRKVLVYNKMAKMTNFSKICHFSHFSQNGDFFEKVGTLWKKSGLFEKSRDLPF